jgi:ATP-dependent DNA ligase
MLDGEDLRVLPLEERRDRLERLLRDAPVTGMAFSDHASGNGDKMFEAACRMGLEGIVAKRTGSRYVSGRSRHWLKIKNPAFVRPDASVPERRIDDGLPRTRNALLSTRSFR